MKLDTAAVRGNWCGGLRCGGNRADCSSNIGAAESACRCTVSRVDEGSEEIVAVAGPGGDAFSLFEVGSVG